MWRILIICKFRECACGDAHPVRVYVYYVELVLPLLAKG